MNIAYSCNDYYIPQTGISMISLFENNKEVEDICVYLISKDVSIVNINILKEICNSYGRRFVEVRFEDIAYDLKLTNTGRHIATIYSKVFFSRISGVDKIIYLDSDTVVIRSLEALWNESIDDYYMGVVETNPTKYYKELGLPKGERFFNDGMAIINVDFCRRNNLIGQILKVLDEYNGNPPTLSEGALNKVCYGKVKYISLKYNLMAGLLFMAKLDAKYLSNILHYCEEEIIESINYPVVIHFLSAFYNRPWLTPCTHPYKDEYFKYQALSPWKDVAPEFRPLPKRVLMIKWCYELLGPRLCNYLRRLVSPTC